MKGSAVFQGLKDWASKFHPQLPLNSKESQRLLTALTSSFRKQLDEAHPQPVSGEVRKENRLKPSSPRPAAQHLHSSSVTLADRHLASVLTSPLLANHAVPRSPVLDYTSAKLTLQKNPSQDPISLLEDYHEKGVASIPLAVLCLEAFNASLASLTLERRRNAIKETKAGRRTLLWIWNSDIHETEAFLEDKRLMGLVTRLVVKEGYEELLWKWIRCVMTL